MSVDRRLKVVLCWHMHQPEYRDLSSGEYQLPWTCLHANKARMIEAFAPYRCLARMAAWLDEEPEAVQYFGEQYLSDLVVWYHLAWMGETVRRQDPRIELLFVLGCGYTLHERRELLEVIGDLIGGVIGRFRALAARGQIELSVNPYAHPIVPLLLNIDNTREAMPHAILPGLAAYPGGEDRARWLIEK